MSAPCPSKPSEVKEWCISGGFHPNKTLGQNFLIDGNAVSAIIALAGIGEGSRVLEVGPGLGALTRSMVGAGAHVVAVEKDARLASLLEGSMDKERCEIITADMLSLDLDALLGRGFDAFVSNLPYSVGTRILLDVARHPLAPKTCAVMLQKEVVERLCAAHSTPKRSQAGVWLQNDYHVALSRKVPPTCFWPKPEIASAVMKMERREDASFSPAERAAFEDATKLAFMHRRKQLGGIFRAGRAALGLETEGDVLLWLDGAGVSPLRRPESVTREEWRALAAALAAAREKRG